MISWLEFLYGPPPHLTEEEKREIYKKLLTEEEQLQFQQALQNDAITFGSSSYKDEIYSVSTSGGTHNKGTIFKCNILTGQTTILYSLHESEGRDATWVVRLNDGRLIVCCLNGGLYNGGTLFEFNTETNTGVVRHHFNTPQTQPNCAFTGYSNNLYVITRSTGRIYEFNLSDWTYVIKYTFVQATGYVAEFAALGPHTVYGLNESIFGLCIQGGTNNKGVLYEYNIKTGVYYVRLNLNDLAVAFSNSPSYIYFEDEFAYFCVYDKFVKYNIITHQYTIVKTFLAPIAPVLTMIKYGQSFYFISQNTPFNFTKLDSENREQILFSNYSASGIYPIQMYQTSQRAMSIFNGKIYMSADNGGAVSFYENGNNLKSFG